jgi:hypothetical protein
MFVELVPNQVFKWLVIINLTFVVVIIIIIIITTTTIKGKVVPLHAMVALGGRGGITPTLS